MVKLPLIDTGERTLGQNRYTYPSTYWESVASRDYRSHNGHVDEIEVPDVSCYDINQNDVDKERMRNRLWEEEYRFSNHDMDYNDSILTPSQSYRKHNKYIRSKFNLSERYKSETKDQYTAMETPRTGPMHKSQIALGIVPVNDFVEPAAEQDSLRPFIDRDKQGRMGSLPKLRYTRRKNSNITPRAAEVLFPDYDDSIMYNDVIPRTKYPSRRKYIPGPRDSFKITEHNGPDALTYSDTSPRKYLPHMMTSHVHEPDNDVIDIDRKDSISKDLIAEYNLSAL